MTLYDESSNLTLTIEGYELSIWEREASSDFTRTTTVIALSGGGKTGYGEGVTYDLDGAAEAQRTLSEDEFFDKLVLEI